jgi:hypothetical protein
MQEHRRQAAAAKAAAAARDKGSTRGAHPTAAHMGMSSESLAFVYTPLRPHYGLSHPTWQLLLQHHVSPAVMDVVGR